MFWGWRRAVTIVFFILALTYKGERNNESINMPYFFRIWEILFQELDFVHQLDLPAAKDRLSIVVVKVWRSQRCNKYLYIQGPKPSVKYTKWHFYVSPFSFSKKCYYLCFWTTKYFLVRFSKIKLWHLLRCLFFTGRVSCSWIV